MLMGLIQRLFGVTREVIALPNFDAGNKAVEISTTILRECIDLGFAGADGPNRDRLARPFACGYLFGFSGACIHQLGVFDELESQALITLVHVRIFGHKIGSLRVGEALRDRRDAEFCRGAAAGTEDLRRWLNDRSYTPFLLTAYLKLNDETSSPGVQSLVSPAEPDVEPRTTPSTDAPSRWNTGRVKQRVLGEPGSGKSATIIQLPTRPRLKTAKPIKS